MNWPERAFWAIFDRKPDKRASDLAHFVAPIVSLTMLSAMVGVNASKLPDNAQTTFNIVVAILVLGIFYTTMEVLWESIRNKQIWRSIEVAILLFFLPRLFSPELAKISGNQSLVDGVLYGWLISFIFMAVLAPNADKRFDDEGEEAEVEAKKND